ncbi:MAG: acyltransferase [Bifidobacterium minimum]|jgi:acetyltransferase-like isoleucine patch superfamily enzyme|nr:acyltransferase [Bifidobacterium minimum]
MALGSIKRFAKDILAHMVYGHKSSEQRYVRWLRSQGMRIGEYVHLYSPWTIKVDTQRPWMVQIGNHVHISADCSILQHDYSWAVIQKLTGEVLGSCGRVVIGDNVFIGQKCLILKGAEIGDNSIVGAGSVVSGKLEGNAVYAGVPARKLMSLQDFIHKRRSAQYEEAKSLVMEYREIYGKDPDERLLREFFWLFASRDVHTLDPVFSAVLDLDGNGKSSTSRWLESEPEFASFQDFVDSLRN